MAKEPASLPFFNCISCFENVNSCQPLLMPDGNSICVDCFEEGYRAKFDAAVDSETQYPVEWGADELDPHFLSNLFSPSFLSLWDAKVDEYATDSNDRLYCPSRKCRAYYCNNFLGKRSSHDNTQPCEKCGSYACARCKGVFEDEIRDHECEGSKIDNPFSGLKEGVEYQRCPRCQQAVEIIDGCNHLQHGNISFCFLCGKRTRQDYSPWRKGMPCILWGQPGEGSEMNADDDMIVVQEDIVDGEEDIIDDQEGGPGLFAPFDWVESRHVQFNLVFFNEINEKTIRDFSNDSPDNETREARIRRLHRQRMRHAYDNEDWQAMRAAFGWGAILWFDRAFAIVLRTLTTYSLQQMPIDGVEFAGRKQYLVGELRQMEHNFEQCGENIVDQQPAGSSRCGRGRF